VALVANVDRQGFAEGRTSFELVAALQVTAILWVIGWISAFMVSSQLCVPPPNTIVEYRT
jgi:hypothetical protein